MRTFMVAASLLLSACTAHEHGNIEKGSVQSEDPRPALAFTHWTDDSELFVEFRALVKGQESPCAAHVTRLKDFSPLAEGSVSIVLRGGPTEERFDSQKPSVPGIFRPVAKPASAGKRRLVAEIRGPGLSVDHDLGDVTVFDSVEEAKKGTPPEAEAPGRIKFLKEQQWPTEFATAMAGERELRTLVRATGVIRARSDGDVTVVAPVAGRVSSANRAFPRLGERVTLGDSLAVMAPRLESADLASLDLAVASANLELRFAEREQQRLEALRVEGAVPERRVHDAAHATEEARTTLTAAQRRLDQYRRIQGTQGRGEGALQLRAPLSGSVTEVRVAPGTFVEAGEPLFRVTDVTQLWLEARVAEIDATGLGAPRGASFTVDGLKESIELPPESLVGKGQIIDPVTRTLPLQFALDDASCRVQAGSFARVQIAIGEPRRALAVPESALVEDSGVFVAFVQVEGEAFERRIVRPGIRDGGYVEIAGGIAAGEHVVTRGAWSVKLAASGGSVPAHGHAH